MELKAVVSLKPEQSVEMRKVFDSLVERFGNTNEWYKLFETKSNTSGYAHYICRGKLREGIKVNELELSMLVDSGFSHFGGQSVLSADGSFYVKIYTD